MQITQRCLFMGLFLVIANLLVAQNEEDSVKAACSHYFAALDAKDGIQAINYIDESGIQYYNDILEKVKTCKKETFDSLPIVDKMAILYVRYFFPKKEILTFNGQTLLIRLVSDGLLGDNILEPSPGLATINGNQAQLTILYMGQDIGFSYPFVKEQGRWKIKSSEILKMSEPILQEMIVEVAAAGQSEDAFLESNVKMMADMKGKEKQNDIWNPLLP